MKLAFESRPDWLQSSCTTHTCIWSKSDTSPQGPKKTRLLVGAHCRAFINSSMPATHNNCLIMVNYHQHHYSCSLELHSSDLPGSLTYRQFTCPCGSGAPPVSPPPFLWPLLQLAAHTEAKWPSKYPSPYYLPARPLISHHLELKIPVKPFLLGIQKLSTFLAPNSNLSPENLLPLTSCSFFLLHFLLPSFNSIYLLKLHSSSWLPSINTGNTPVTRQSYISLNPLLILSKSLGHLICLKWWLMTLIRPKSWVITWLLRTAGPVEIARSHNHNNDSEKWRDVCKKY